MKKVKILVISLVCLAALIVFLQNRESVETELIFATVKMPRALLLIVTFLLGFLSGIIATSYVSRRRK